MLLNKTDKIDGLQEENELLKSEISQISNELLRANSQISSLFKDVTALRNENEQLVSSNSKKIDKESYRWEQKYKEAELQSKRSDEKVFYHILIFTIILYNFSHFNFTFNSNVDKKSLRRTVGKSKIL
jgi:hypothetical protein